MLEHVPNWLGQMLRRVRAGAGKLVIADTSLGLGSTAIDLSSPAFADGARLPERFTADGAGISPPMVWGPLPQGTAALALIVEDADAPAPNPLVHAVIWGLPGDVHRIEEGAIARGGDGGEHGDVGRNSFFAEGWLPPDPPTGHGEHHYAFQLFALSERPPLKATPGRGDVVEAMRGRILAAGLLIGTYSRGELAPLSDGVRGAAAQPG